MAGLGKGKGTDRAKGLTEVLSPQGGAPWWVWDQETFG